LPKLLQWFSANIGSHHIHHFRPRIPNCDLEKCLKKTPELQLECPLTLWRSLQSVGSIFEMKRAGLRSASAKPSERIGLVNEFAKLSQGWNKFR
jgi:fatty acid desaturase